MINTNKKTHKYKKEDHVKVSPRLKGKREIESARHTGHGGRRTLHLGTNGRGGGEREKTNGNTDSVSHGEILG